MYSLAKCNPSADLSILHAVAQPAGQPLPRNNSYKISALYRRLGEPSKWIPLRRIKFMSTWSSE
uniref:Uncharacterized protein n=1 Tax=Parascaris univalens TaxID=6257 RepID=A0A915AD99_PARUN